jgi:hypothetical protein
MPRLALLARIVPLLGIAAVAAGAAVGGCFSVEDPDRTGLPVDCDTSDPECVKQIDAAAQAEFPDAKVKEILFENEPIKAIAAGRELGSDYWLSITNVWRPLHGQRVARVNVVFAEPVSYSGEILWASDPCQGHTGEDERLDPDDPCLDEPREYGTRYVIFPNVRDVYATVELGRRDVIEVFTMDTPPDVLEDTIRYYKDPIEYRKYYEGKIESTIGPLPPPSPP